MFGLSSLYLRLIGIGAAVIACLSLAYVVNGWRDDSKALAVERSQFKNERSQFENRLKQLGEQERIAREVASDLLKENARLELGRIANPIGPVRLFVSTSYPAVQIPDAPAGDNGAANGDGLPGRISADIGPSIDNGIILPADIQTARLMACQRWVYETAKTPIHSD